MWIQQLLGFCLFVLVPLIYAHVNKVIGKGEGGGYRLPSVTCFRCHVSGLLAPHVYTLMLLHGSSPHVFQWNSSTETNGGLWTCYFCCVAEGSGNIGLETAVNIRCLTLAVSISSSSVKSETGSVSIPECANSPVLTSLLNLLRSWDLL